MLSVNTAVNERYTHAGAARGPMRPCDIKNIQAVLQTGISIIITTCLRRTGLETMQRLCRFDPLVSIQFCDDALSIRAFRHAINEAVDGQGPNWPVLNFLE